MNVEVMGLKHAAWRNWDNSFLKWIFVVDGESGSNLEMRSSVSPDQVSR